MIFFQKEVFANIIPIKENGYKKRSNIGKLEGTRTKAITDSIPSKKKNLKNFFFEFPQSYKAQLSSFFVSFFHIEVTHFKYLKFLKQLVHLYLLSQLLIF